MKKLTTFSISLIFMCLLTVSIGATFFSQSKASGQQMDIGDIIVQGKIDKNGDCEIPPFTVTTYPPDESNPGEFAWLGLNINDDCEVIVETTWTGTLEDGPSSFIEPLLEFLKTTEPITAPVKLSEDINGYFENLEMPTKTSEQRVFTYGGGGASLDKLTKLTTHLTYGYDGSQVWGISRGGTCEGRNVTYWFWVVDGCYQLAYIPGPGPAIAYDAGGNYHCTPPAQVPCNISNPDGYYHSLFSYIDAFMNGSSSCTFGSSGQVVFGPKRNILQGCN